MTTKADMTREILRKRGRQTDEQVLDAVLKETGLSKGLARVYIRENTERLANPKKKVAKKKAAK